MFLTSSLRWLLLLCMRSHFDLSYDERSFQHLRRPPIMYRCKKKFSPRLRSPLKRDKLYCEANKMEGGKWDWDLRKLYWFLPWKQRTLKNEESLGFYKQTFIIDNKSIESNQVITKSRVFFFFFFFFFLYYIPTKKAYERQMENMLEW